MHPLVSRIGRLQQLAVFEVAATAGSFTAAAAELGMTQPAITRHIRSLEAAVEVQLFDRGPNRVSLNRAGRTLLASVQDGFSAIEGGIEQVRPNSEAFVIAANPGIASQWLVPHLGGLQQVVAPAEVHLWLFDRDAELETGRFDLAFHIGVETAPGLQVRRLLPEVAVPVASPDYSAAAGLSAASTPAELVKTQLLHLDSHNRSWMDWDQWFQLNGMAASNVAASNVATAKVAYSNYALVLQDALAGRGVALGWRPLVDELLRQGLLIDVGPESSRTDSGYLLAWPSTTAPELVDRVDSWIHGLLGRSPAARQ
jgi:LysR family glycine cleavage system transcriptional activator